MNNTANQYKLEGKVLEPVGQTAPLVLNVEFKEQGRVEHLVNFAYNKLKDPPLMFLVTTLWWLLILLLIKRRRSKKHIPKDHK